MNEPPLSEDAAWQVLLAQAIEQRDGAAAAAATEREAADAEARQALGPGASPAAFAVARARQVLARAARREPAWAEWPAPPQPLRGSVALLALAALAAGLATQAIGPSRHVNLLAPPLLGLLAWNLAVYLALLLQWLRPRHGTGAALDAGLGRLGAALGRRIAALGAAPPEASGRAGDSAPWVAARRAWWPIAAPRLAARLAAALHLGAALLAAGAVAGLYLRGLVTDYRAGWESTFLDAGAVHALLSAWLGPAAALLGQSLPDAAALARLRLDAGPGEPAARWIHLHALTLVLAVVLPRLLLAAAAQRRARHAGWAWPWQAPYFARLAALARAAGLPPGTRVAVQPVGLRITWAPAASSEPVPGESGRPDTRAGPRAAAPPSPGEQRLAGALGLAPGDVRLLPPLPTGPDGLPVLEALRSRGLGPGERLLPLFPAQATPQAEWHGVVLAGWPAPAEPGERLALLDEGGWLARLAPADRAARQAQRRAAWQALLAAQGWRLLPFSGPEPAGPAGLPVPPGPSRADRDELASTDTDTASGTSAGAGTGTGTGTGAGAGASPQQASPRGPLRGAAADPTGPVATITLSLVSHTNVGKTTLARTLLRRDIGEVRDAAHVTLQPEGHRLVESAAGDVLELWDTPGFADSVRLARRLAQADRPLGWFLAQVWDRVADRAFWLNQRALRHVIGRSDVVLYLVQAGDDADEPATAASLQAELDVLQAIGKPVLVLLNQLDARADAAARDATVAAWRRRLGDRPVLRGCLAFDAFARAWTTEGRLLDALAGCIEPARRGAFERLDQAWTARNRAVFDAAIEALAQALARAALDREAVTADGLLAPVRRLGRAVGLGGDRPDAGERALQALGGRLDADLRGLATRLLALHGLDGGAGADLVARLAARVALRAPIGEGAAATLGGVLTGALAGLKADLATGGLSLGAGLLLGGLAGALGGAGLARGLNQLRGVPQPTFAWDDTLLERLPPALLRLYAAVAHHGRGRGAWQDGDPPGGTDEALPAVLAPQAAALSAAWRAARQALPPEPSPAVRRDAEAALATRLAPPLRQAAVDLLRQLHPEARPRDLAPAEPARARSGGLD
ncbi:DUF3482 domain-containing protein [Piscinibacter sakaiensis]|uniref:G domain-containing protein n=1 Tax=Piscinibacter sakaiensis TaxID=1547922 RepID=A0A0K8P4C9_PISS1|nr:DUF3482 domain-containing protein [Piscinibacter sakaiensis]GAP37015.1 hypothetical protein ISF6_2870 [Piscinibacter sakaiensis]